MTELSPLTISFRTFPPRSTPCPVPTFIPSHSRAQPIIFPFTPALLHQSQRVHIVLPTRIIPTQRIGPPGLLDGRMALRSRCWAVGTRFKLLSRAFDPGVSPLLSHFFLTFPPSCFCQSFFISVWSGKRILLIAKDKQVHLPTTTSHHYLPSVAPAHLSSSQPVHHPPPRCPLLPSSAHPPPKPPYT